MTKSISVSVKGGLVKGVDNTEEETMRTRNDRRLFHDLVSKVKNQEHRDREVIRDKRGMIPVSLQENAPIRKDDDEKYPNE